MITSAELNEGLRFWNRTFLYSGQMYGNTFYFYNKNPVQDFSLNCWFGADGRAGIDCHYDNKVTISSFVESYESFDVLKRKLFSSICDFHKTKNQIKQSE